MITKVTYYNAIKYAVAKHGNQFRKETGDPYIVHPLAVASIVTTVKKSKNRFLLGTASVLHDLVEDTDVTLQNIADVFGHQVASIVAEVTNDKEQLEALGKANYLAKKMEQMTSYALVIKLADRYHNTLDLKALSEADRRKKKTETRYILKHLKNTREFTKTHKKLIAMIEKNLQN